MTIDHTKVEATLEDLRLDLQGTIATLTALGVEPADATTYAHRVITDVAVDMARDIAYQTGPHIPDDQDDWLAHSTEETVA